LDLGAQGVVDPIQVVEVWTDVGRGRSWRGDPLTCGQIGGRGSWPDVIGRDTQDIWPDVGRIDDTAPIDAVTFPCDRVALRIDNHEIRDEPSGVSRCGQEDLGPRRNVIPFKPYNVRIAGISVEHAGQAYAEATLPEPWSGCQRECLRTR
jgi:hypothetical protein